MRLKFVARENPLHLAAHRLVKAVALLAEGVVDQQKAAVGEKTAQVLDLLLRERLELVFAGEIEKRIIEQVPIGESDFVTGRPRLPRWCAPSAPPSAA